MKDENFDVCVSLMPLAQVAKELCEGGAKVVMLKRDVESLYQSCLHKWPHELPYRGLRGEKQSAALYQGDIAKSIT